LKKTFVLDTSVLLHDPQALYAFADNDLVVPAVVLEELDRHKGRPDEVGRNARAAARILDGLRREGRLDEGVLLPEGGLLTIELNHKSLEAVASHFPTVNNDNRILAVALNLTLEAGQPASGGKPRVILVSRDAVLRVKADAVGVSAQDYRNDKVPEQTDGFRGWSERDVPGDQIDEFYATGRLSVPDWGLRPNEFVILREHTGLNKSAMARYDARFGELRPLVFREQSVWGIHGRNVQQKMALELLMNDEVQLVTLEGRAGTGKTLLALAAGLMKMEEERRYSRLLVTRPVVPVGKDIGFLPGDKGEKLRPWMQPIFDNLEFLFGTSGKRDLSVDQILAGMREVQVEALSYIRGRTLPGQFIIVDEVQNMTRHEVKTLVTRAGEGSKVVLVGDPEQIDHPYLDSTSNGLVYLREKFQSSPLAGHVTLVKGERSELAQLAADLL